MIETCLTGDSRVMTAKLFEWDINHRRCEKGGNGKCIILYKTSKIAESNSYTSLCIETRNRNHGLGFIPSWKYTIHETSFEPRIKCPTTSRELLFFNLLRNRERPSQTKMIWRDFMFLHGFWMPKIRIWIATCVIDSIFSAFAGWRASHPRADSESTGKVGCPWRGRSPVPHYFFIRFLHCFATI